MQQNTTNNFVTLNCGRNDLFIILVCEIVKEVSMLRQTNAQTNKTYIRYIMYQYVAIIEHITPCQLRPACTVLATKKMGGEKNKERSAV